MRQRLHHVDEVAGGMPCQKHHDLLHQLGQGIDWDCDATHHQPVGRRILAERLAVDEESNPRDAPRQSFDLRYPGHEYVRNVSRLDKWRRYFVLVVRHGAPFHNSKPAFSQRAILSQCTRADNPANRHRRVACRECGFCGTNSCSLAGKGERRAHIRLPLCQRLPFARSQPPLARATRPTESSGFGRSQHFRSRSGSVASSSARLSRWVVPSRCGLHLAAIGAERSMAGRRRFILSRGRYS